MLARSKLNSMEILISQELVSNYEISREEYKTIVNEEDNYRRLK